MNILTFRRIIILTLVIVTIAFAATGCTGTKNESGDLSLKVGLMPALDSAPVLLASQNGYFKELGLDVEVLIFNNPQDRQSALQTHTIDGTIIDLIAVATNVDGGFDIKATTMTDGVFPVLMTEGADSKQNIKVGMMEVSVTNFLIDEWLGDKYTIEKVFINDIPTRLSAIGSGQLDMGLFPEPMASMGELNGLIKKLYQPEEGFCPDVMVFTEKALNEKGEAVKLFHEAYNKAVDELNRNKQAGIDIIMEKIPNLKPEIKDKIILPEYTKVSLPDNEYIDKIIQWTANAMKKELKVKAEDLVERRFAEPTNLVIPGVLPNIISALRVSLGVSIATLFFSENFATTYGIGYFIINCWVMVDYVRMFAGILAMSMMGILIFKVIDLTEKKLCPWNFIE